MRRAVIAIASVCAVFFEGACLQKSRPPLSAPPSASDSLTSNNGYQDLAPGAHLRVTLPLLKKGAANFTSAQNLIGFQLLHFQAEGDNTGKVQLNFISAEITKKGHTSIQRSAPPLPFPLPQTAQFIRLVFLLRASEADHNMAIIAAGNRNALELFTTQLNQNPAACQTANNLFCTWVPQGVAVRPE